MGGGGYKLQVAGCGMQVPVCMTRCRLPINTEALCIFRHLGKVKKDEKFRMFWAYLWKMAFR